MAIINLIVTRSRNNVISKDGKIPWHLKSEQILFDELTTENVIIMGQKTYEEIGHPLSNRINIVVSGTKNFGGRIDAGEFTTLLSVQSLKEAVALTEDMENVNIYIIGGHRLYKEALDTGIVDRMYITEVHTELETDNTTVLFPEFNEHQFNKIIAETVADQIPYTRTIYINKNSIWKFTGNGER